MKPTSHESIQEVFNGRHHVALKLGFGSTKVPGRLGSDILDRS